MPKASRIRPGSTFGGTHVGNRPKPPPSADRASSSVRQIGNSVDLRLYLFLDEASQYFMRQALVLHERDIDLERVRLACDVGAGLVYQTFGLRADP